MNAIGLLSLFLLYSCTYTTPVGMREHRFGDQPRKIIWLQIAGLSSEHLIFNKLTDDPAAQDSVFEKFICHGQSFDFSAYGLRSNPHINFQMQLSGSENIEGQCSDVEKKPIWSYLNELKTYRLAIYESLINEQQSLKQYTACQEEQQGQYLDAVALVRSGFLPPVKILDPPIDRENSSEEAEPTPEEENFSHLNKERIRNAGFYRDQSCDLRNCTFPLLENVISLYERYLSKQNKYFLLVRDFRYLDLLNSGKVNEARDYHQQIEQLLRYLIDETNPYETLILVSSGAARPINFPRQGIEWRDYQNKGRGLFMANTSLIAPSYAIGARAENFCGYYHSADFLKRIFYNNRKLKFDFDIL